MTNDEILQQIEDCENGIPCDFGICSECRDRLNPDEHHNNLQEIPGYNETLEHNLKVLSSAFSSLTLSITQTLIEICEKIEDAFRPAIEYIEGITFDALDALNAYFKEYDEIIKKKDRKNYLKNSINHNKVAKDSMRNYFKSCRGRQQKFYHYVRKARNRL